MNDSHVLALRRIALGSGVALALAVAPAAADDGAVRAFAASTEVDSASETLVRRDVLVVRTDETGTSLRLVDGTTASAPVAVGRASDGELLADTNEPSVTCYNMAEMLANAARHPSERPPAVFVALAGRAVAVPMPFRIRRGQAGTDSILGTGTASVVISSDGAQTPTSATVAVTARVDRSEADVESAAFTESTSIVRGNATRPVGRTTCSIVRMAVPVAS